MSKKRKKKRTGMGFVLFTVLVLYGIVSYNRQGLRVTYEKSEAKIQELQQKIQVENQKTEEIKAMKAYVQTSKYVEDMAREKLGLVYPDEIIFQAEE